MKYKKSELTAFAKQLAFAHHQYLNAMCIAEEVAKSNIGRQFKNNHDEQLLLEIAKRYAKYTRNECNIDFDNAETQDCQNIINDIINCCEENDWFKNTDSI